ncbi:hypothetical protein HZA38_04250 [Candidatus Peregrinibacteria bacterium]|nr:hypothetical protein [Candidatus Peregrinibacteria bacterium]
MKLSLQFFSKKSFLFGIFIFLVLAFLPSLFSEASEEVEETITPQDISVAVQCWERDPNDHHCRTGDIFANRYNWYSASSKAHNSIFNVLQKLQGSYVSSTPPQSYGRFGRFFDVNGDGLLDILYHEGYRDGNSVGTFRTFFALFLNIGGTNFELVYKCTEEEYSDPRYNTYYGNCAAGAPETREDNMIYYALNLLYFAPPGSGGHETETVDINGDGLVDIVESNRISLNKGNFNFQEISIQAP